MAMTFSEWRRENSGTRADYDDYLSGLVEAAAAANTQVSLPDDIDCLLDAIHDLGVLTQHGAIRGAADVIAERRRQIEDFGYTALHDDSSPDSLVPLARRQLDHDELAEGAAALAAEIDRLHRLKIRRLQGLSG